MKPCEPNSFWHFLQTLSRRPGEGKIAGICEGLSSSTPVPAGLWRVAFLVSVFCGGMGIIAYLILWLFMPVAKDTPQNSAGNTSSCCKGV